MYKLLNKENSNSKYPQLAINKLICPFSYELPKQRRGKSPFGKIVESLTEKGKWHYSIKPILSGNNELYSHIEQLIQYDNNDKKNSIGTMLSYADKLEGNGIVSIKDNSKEISLNINSADMLLFKTGVGLLMLDISYDTNVLDDIILGNNIVKYLIHGKKKYAFNKKGEQKGDYFEYTKEKKISIDIPQESILDAPEEGKEYIQTQLFGGGKPKNAYIPAEYVSGNNDDRVKVIFNNDAEAYRVEYKAEEKMHISDLVLDLLSSIDNVEFFNSNKLKQENKGFNHCLVKANVFSMAILEECQKDEIEYKNKFYWLSKGYKSSYVLGDNAIDFDNNDSIFSPFKDNYWGISREGLANMCMPTGSDNIGFYRSGYDEKICNYFYLYLIVLHQYYGLIKLSSEVAALPSSMNEYMGWGRINHDKVIDIKNKINFFYMKCIYKEVSHITHQNEIYSRMHKVLSINDMMHELDSECTTIGDLLDTEKEKRAKNNRRIFGLIGGLFAIISTINCIWQWVTYYSDDYIDNPVIIDHVQYSMIGLLSSMLILIVVALVCAGCVKSFWWIVKKMKTRK